MRKTKRWLKKTASACLVLGLALMPTASAWASEETQTEAMEEIQEELQTETVEEIQKESQTEVAEAIQEGTQTEIMEETQDVEMKVETEQSVWAAYTGLVNVGGNRWYYQVSGVTQWNYTGLVNYYGTWYYVEKGILNWGYTGLTQYYGTWYYVEKGVLNWGYIGLTQYYGTWYYVEKGVLNWGYTGLTQYCGNWYYVEKGMLNWNYTGFTYYNGTRYYVKNGAVDWNHKTNAELKDFLGYYLVNCTTEYLKKHDFANPEVISLSIRNGKLEGYYGIYYGTYGSSVFYPYDSYTISGNKLVCKYSQYYMIDMIEGKFTTYKSGTHTYTLLDNGNLSHDGDILYLDKNRTK